METRHDLPYIRGYNFGIDPSLNHTGICILTQYECKTLNIEPGDKMRGIPRLVYLRDAVREVIMEQGPPSRVMIEGYAFSRGSQAHAKGEWGGLLRVMLYEMQVPLLEITPSGLKKFVTNKGDGPKSAMMLAMYKRWGLEIPDEDECDAAGLAMAAAYYRAPELCQPTVPQREALSKVNVLGPAVRHRSRGLQPVVKNPKK